VISRQREPGWLGSASSYAVIELACARSPSARADPAPLVGPITVDSDFIVRNCGPDANSFHALATSKIRFSSATTPGWQADSGAHRLAARDGSLASRHGRVVLGWPRADSKPKARRNLVRRALSRLGFMLAMDREYGHTSPVEGQGWLPV
jgi:hypothetical protein